MDVRAGETESSLVAARLFDFFQIAIRMSRRRPRAPGRHRFPRARRREAQRDALLASQAEAPQSPPAILQNLRGIGPEFAMIFWSEGLFRHFANRRQLASYAGLAPTPRQSGTVAREQGVSKAGSFGTSVPASSRFALTRPCDAFVRMPA
jgi:transposase